MEMNSSVFDESVHQNLLNWPPFYTLQQHKETRNKQFQYWAQIIHNRLIRHNIQECSFDQLKNDDIFVDNSTNIQKKMNDQSIKELMDYMNQQGYIKYEQNNNNFYVFKHSLAQLSDAIYKWSKTNYKTNSIETLYWVIQGDDTDSKEIFYGQPEQIVLQALQILEDNGKAEVYEIDEKYSVKFL